MPCELEAQMHIRIPRRAAKHTLATTVTPPHGTVYVTGPDIDMLIVCNRRL